MASGLLLIAAACLELVALCPGWAHPADETPLMAIIRRPYQWLPPVLAAVSIALSPARLKGSRTKRLAALIVLGIGVLRLAMQYASNYEQYERWVLHHVNTVRR
jgi:hypothetical protein